MTFFFTPHARDRARERYGIELSAAEMGGIARACESGQATKMSERAGGIAYAWMIGTIRVYPVVKDGVIKTFLPSDWFLASTAKRHRKERARRAS